MTGTLASNPKLKDEYATFESTTGLVQKKPISSSLKAKAVVLGFLLLAIGAFVGQKASQALAEPLELTDIVEVPLLEHAPDSIDISVYGEARRSLSSIGWTATAFSDQRITSRVTFMCTHNNIMPGLKLAASTTSDDWKGLDFGFCCRPSGKFEVFENGQNKYTSQSTAATTEVLEIAINQQTRQVQYIVGGNVEYTSTKTISESQNAHFAIAFHEPSSVTNIKIPIPGQLCTKIPSQQEQDYRPYPDTNPNADCNYIERHYQSCTNDVDTRHAYTTRHTAAMLNCPITCAKARGESCSSAMTGGFELTGADMVFSGAASPTNYVYFQTDTAEGCATECAKPENECTVFSFGAYGCRMPPAGREAVGSAGNNVYSVPTIASASETA